MTMFKIAHLTSAHPSFDIRIFQKECRTFAKRDYEVVLIAQNERDEKVGGVQIRAIPQPRNRIERMTLTVWQVFKTALKENADLYHFHDPELIPIALLLKMRGHKVVYDVHEDFPRALLSPGRDYLPRQIRWIVSWLLEKLENFSVRCFTACIAATPAIAARFSKIQPKTFLICNFPILDELFVPTCNDWKERHCAVTYVGGIALTRGLRQMVEAMGHLPETLGARLKLAGSFSPPQCRAEVTQMVGWKYVDELTFLGRQDLAQLLSKVQAGLVLFHPEPNHTEAQPNKLFEYMSAGIPVIASNFPLWRGLINRERCGLLVDPLDPDAIAKAIEYLLTHPNEAEAMGKRGRAAVARQYNWSVESQKLLTLYKTTLISPNEQKPQKA